jgi:phosphoribosylanthranilate isomerase
VECGGGALPGGNALAWDWSAAAGLSRLKPLVLAGGLNPNNIALAIEAALPDAVDVSSGVELRPGKKDVDKIKAFMEAVQSVRLRRKPKQIF